MAEYDSRILIDHLCFDNETIFYGKRKEITFHVLGAIWTIKIFFYRSFGLKLQLPFQTRERRVLLKLKCEKLRRKVHAETKILITSTKPPTSINRREVFRNDITEGDSFLELGTDLESVYDDIISLNMSGELKIYVNTENYFYYKQNMCFLPEDSKIQTIHLQVMHELSSDWLAFLIQQEDTSDVVLRCESIDYKAHKVVLSARSKVFSAMFQHPLKESETNVVEIKEMSPAVLGDVLEYIYSGKVGTFNDKNAYELVSAAEQYDLPGLKKLSVYYIQSKLSRTNALSTLSFAKLYDEDLKNKTLDFICMEFDHLKGTEEWRIFQNVQPLLANEVLSKIIQFIQSGSVFQKKAIISRHPSYLPKIRINQF